MSDNNIVIWGAGRIGRGFIADLFDAAGYHITLVDQSPELIAALRAAGRYTVVCAEGRDQRHDRIIRGFTALSTDQADPGNCRSRRRRSGGGRRLSAAFPGCGAADHPRLAAALG